jgi:PPOX class probable F420-dependent enzyme
VPAATPARSTAAGTSTVPTTAGTISPTAAWASAVSTAPGTTTPPPPGPLTPPLGPPPPALLPVPPLLPSFLLLPLLPLLPAPLPDALPLLFAPPEPDPAPPVPLPALCPELPLPPLEPLPGAAPPPLPLLLLAPGPPVPAVPPVVSPDGPLPCRLIQVGLAYAEKLDCVRDRRLSDGEIQRFLATREVVLLATVQADGSPLAMPVWFVHDREDLTIVSEAATQKVRNLRRDPRVCVVAESGSREDARAVIMGGRAQMVPESADRRALVRALLAKYHPHLERRWGGDTMPADRVMFRITPAWVRTWGM